MNKTNHPGGCSPLVRWMSDTTDPLILAVTYEYDGGELTVTINETVTVINTT